MLSVAPILSTNNKQKQQKFNKITRTQAVKTKNKKKMISMFNLYLVKTASRTPTRASSAGTNEPTWARIAIKATYEGGVSHVCLDLNMNSLTDMIFENIEWLGQLINSLLPVRSLVRSIVRLFPIRSFVRSFIRSFVRAGMRSLLSPSVSFVCSLCFVRSHVHSSRSFVRSNDPSLI